MMFGDIKDMVRKYDWALILYDKPEAAQEAIREMNGIYIEDAQVEVKMAEKRAPKRDLYRESNKPNSVEQLADNQNFIAPPLGKRKHSERDQGSEEDTNELP